MSNIIELNRDVEQYVLQSAHSRAKHHYKDTTVPLTFVHSSDMHACESAWTRMVEFINHFEDVISFGLHTGDYCGGSQKVYKDLYGSLPCNRTIYNCVGNHDCFNGEGPWLLAEKHTAHSLLFSRSNEWDVNFMDCDCSMSYYKDFEQNNIRLIVLDDYYDLDACRKWLKSLLDEALEKNLHVITAQHQTTGYVNNTFNTKFHFLDDYNKIMRDYEAARTKYAFDQRSQECFEKVIAEFINKGGNYVCNLAGHDHVDQFGLTDDGILNVVVQNGTTWDALGDTKRIKGTKSEDCFNVVSVDTTLNLIKIVRIGANVDHYLRTRNALTFDYKAKRVICEY